MPNLINVIRQARRAQEDSNANAKNKTGKMQTNEERRAEVAKLLRGETSKSDEDAVTNCDMEWGAWCSRVSKTVVARRMLMVIGRMHRLRGRTNMFSSNGTLDLSNACCQ